MNNCVPSSIRLRSGWVNSLISCLLPLVCLSKDSSTWESQSFRFVYEVIVVATGGDAVVIVACYPSNTHHCVLPSKICRFLLFTKRLEIEVSAFPPLNFTHLSARLRIFRLASLSSTSPSLKHNWLFPYHHIIPRTPRPPWECKR